MSCTGHFVAFPVCVFFLKVFFCGDFSFEGHHFLGISVGGASAVYSHGPSMEGGSFEKVMDRC